MKNTMQIVQAGLFSVVQDLGRQGWQKLGVAVNGAMDEAAHQRANALVGNERHAAVLECTLLGPTVRFSEDAIVALCGADMQAQIGTVRIPLNRALFMRRGTELRLAASTQGARCYLAVRGGLDVPAVLGSRSTNSRAGFGGLQGRGLRAGDAIAIGQAVNTPRPRIDTLGIQSGLPVVFAPAVPDAPMPHDTSPDHGPIRLIPGPHWQAFTAAAREALVTESFEMSQQSDRMGARLKGPALQLDAPLELVSEATVFGTVQVPPDGQPIILMADRESAGGYPKIAYVAAVDLPRLAQTRPGDALRFCTISQTEAEALWRQAQQDLARWCEQARSVLAPSHTV